MQQQQDDYKLIIRFFIEKNLIREVDLIQNRPYANAVAKVLNYKYESHIFTAAAVQRVAYIMFGGTNEQSLATYDARIADEQETNKAAVEGRYD